MQNQIPGIMEDENIREAFPALKKVNYLNIGTYGLMPDPAIEKFQNVQAEFERTGQASNGACYQMTNHARKTLASMMGVEPEEIAFTRNATDGINLVLSGIQWQPGDEVITTDQEHEAMIHPLLYLQNTKGIQTRLVEVSSDPQEMVARINNVANEKTRLVAMSLVTCETGTCLPAKEITDWAKEHQLLSLFDGAQASGAFSLDITKLGCDFYASNGHKWLSGPKGTGFFIIRKEQLDKLSPAHIGAGSLVKAEIASMTAIPNDSALRFEFGTRSWALTAGLSASLEWFDSLGWPRVYQHIRSLTRYLKESILERPSMELITPLNEGHSSGLTSFRIKGTNAGEVAKKLRENYATYVRVIPHYNAIRIATAHFNLPYDIDRLMKAIDTILSE